MRRVPIFASSYAASSYFCLALCDEFLFLPRRLGKIKQFKKLFYLNLFIFIYQYHKKTNILYENKYFV